MIPFFKDKINFYVRYNFLFHKYLSFLTEIDAENIVLQKNIQFKLVFERALKSKFYRKLYGEYGVNLSSIKGIEDIKRLPIIDKSVIKANVDQLWVGWKPKLKAYTSGSTGSPLVLYRSINSVIREQAYVWAYRKSKGFALGSPLVSLRGHLDQSVFSRFDRSHNTLFLSSYNIGRDTFESYINAIRAFKPKAIEAYPSSIYSLSLLMQENNFKLDIPFVFTSSEPLLSHQRALIEKTFNCEVFDWYGNAERTIALQLERDNRYYEPPLYSVNEFSSEGLVTTSLINLSFPLIRYRVDDILEGVKTTPIFSASSILGRNDDVVILSNGVRIGRLDHVFKNIEGIRYAQIIQEVDYSLTVMLDCSSSFTRIEEQIIRNNFLKYLGNSCRISFVFSSVDCFVKSKSGKFRFVVNRLLNEV